MDKELLKKVRAKLTFGDRTAIAREAHVSPSTVLFWLEGKCQPLPRNEEKLIAATQKILSAKVERMKRGNEVFREILTEL